ncbi:MAG TPA: molybdate ABC transporter substrate-binding protein [Phycisphaerae bacterium]|nr:molybdate ABC transporter substrate-binding protein [Phycisphaerae bacterium]
MRKIFAVIACVCMTAAAGAEEIRVAAAISMKEALTDAAEAYQKAGGDEVQFAFGSSGALSAQVRNSRNIDLFVSAAEQQMDDLQADKLIDAKSRRDIAANALVLVVPAGAAFVPTQFTQLADPGCRRIAIGERRTVPAGAYAITLLTNLKLAEAVRGKLVYGENVRQVLTYVERGEVDAGIVYATDAKESGGQVKVAVTADAKDCPRVEYPAAVVAGSDHAAGAQEFLDFLSSEAGQKILAARGFQPPAPERKP